MVRWCMRRLLLGAVAASLLVAPAEAQEPCQAPPPGEEINILFGSIGYGSSDGYGWAGYIGPDGNAYVYGEGSYQGGSQGIGVGAGIPGRGTAFVGFGPRYGFQPKICAVVDLF